MAVVREFAGGEKMSLLIPEVKFARPVIAAIGNPSPLAPRSHQEPINKRHNFYTAPETATCSFLTSHVNVDHAIEPLGALL